MNRKKKTNLTDKLIEETSLSGPAPDSELITEGIDMYWSPTGNKIKEMSKDNSLEDIL